MSESIWKDVKPGTARYEFISLLPAWWVEPVLEEHGSSVIAEIRSGAILHDPACPGRYMIEANTARGLRRFRHARELQPRDPQSEEFAHLAAPQQVFVVCKVGWTFSYSGETEPMVWPVTGQSRAALPEKGLDLPPGKVLERLKGGQLSHAERGRLIVEAEILHFEPVHVGDLLKLLRSFIEQHRDSNDPEDLIAVAAAIRKYVAESSVADINSLAVLLDAGHKAPVPVEIELEVAKMLVRKLSANPPAQPDSEPGLADRLMEIARAYLNPRLLPREKYGAVVLNTVLALLLLRSRHVPELLGLVVQLPYAWFKDLLVRRARKIQEEVCRRIPADQVKESLACVEALIQAVTTPSR